MGLDDLPRYSAWPSRLLGLAPWTPKRRTTADLEREYEVEKWGQLLARAVGEGAKLDDVESWDAGDDHLLVVVDDEWVVAAAGDVRTAYVKFVARALAPYVSKATTLAELGAGYGGLLLRVARDFSLPLYGADFAANGVELMRRIAAVEHVRVEGARCDLSKTPITQTPPPPGSLIFTSYAACYVSPVTREFVDAMCALRPSTVVHFEPFYEQAEVGTLLGLMQRRYIEVNDYSTNLLTTLEDAAKRGQIEILARTNPLFAANPLLPASVIAWRPARR